MASLVDVVNQALVRLGQGRITALTDNVRAAIVANAEATQLLDDELRRNVWKFARQRTKLIPDPTPPAWGYTYRYALPTGFAPTVAGSDDFWSVRALLVDGEDESSGRWTLEGRYLLTDIVTPTLSSFAWTNANLNTGLDTFIGMAADYEDGDGPLWLSSATDALPGGLYGQTDYYIHVINSSSFSLHPTAADAVAGTNKVAISPGGSGNRTIGPPTLAFLYVGRKTDPDVWDASFRSLMVARYADAWAETITGDPNKIQESALRLREERRQAPTPSAQEGIPDPNEATDWIAARFAGARALVGDL